MKYKFILLLVIVSFSVYSQKNCICLDGNKQSTLFFDKALDSISTFSKSNHLKNTNKSTCLFEAFSLEFVYYLENNRLKKAEEIINKQEKLVVDLDCETSYEIHLLLNKVLFLRATNSYEKLAALSLSALKRTNTLADKSYEIEFLKQLVFVYTRLNEDEKVWKYVIEAEKIIESATFSKNNEINNLIWLGYEYENKYNKTKDNKFLEKSKKYILSAKEKVKGTELYTELTKIYRALEAISFHEQDLNKALKYIDTAIFFGKKISGTKNLSGLYLSKAWDHFDLKQFEEVEKWTDTMLKVDTKADIGGYMMTLLQASELYEGSGKIEKSLSAFKKYNHLKDSILQIDRIKAINELETKYQTELKDAEIKLKDTKIERLTFFIIIVLIIIIAILFFIKNKELKTTKKLNIALQNAIDKKDFLEKEIANVRNAIARDFHDDLGNVLARISVVSKMVLATNKEVNDKIKQSLHQINNDANELYSGTKDFIFSLKTHSNKTSELLDYLSDFGKNLFDNSITKFEIENQIKTDTTLPYYWSKQLIFIFKEVLTNAYKHAKASNVMLRFYTDKDTIQITVVDNGVGINEYIHKNSNGLENIKQRAKQIQQQLEISSTKSGTQIQFTGKQKTDD